MVPQPTAESANEHVQIGGKEGQVVLSAALPASSSSWAKPARRVTLSSCWMRAADDDWTHYFAWFFAGAFLVNAVPHVVSGVTGRAFQTPFGKPPGEGLSTSTVNVLWGFFNLAAGYLLLFCVGTFEIRAIDHAISMGLGAILTALLLAHRFGRFHDGHAPGKS